MGSVLKMVMFVGRATTFMAGVAMIPFPRTRVIKGRKGRSYSSGPVTKKNADNQLLDRHCWLKAPRAEVVLYALVVLLKVPVIVALHLPHP
jgi:hypothetical protein